MENLLNTENLLSKKEKLEAARNSLKNHFVGIDNVIDDLIANIQVWYLMPELLVRPVIINLWGLTGVGKTDLVRRLVNLLDFQDRFAQIELVSKDSGRWRENVYGALDNHQLNDEKPSIVLFDEVQKFETIDSKGQPITQTGYIDFWELLSDGKLSRKEKEDFDQYLFDFYLSKQKTKVEQDGNQNEFMLDYWQAKQIANSLGDDLALEDVADLSQSQVINLIKNAKKNKKIYAPINHAKTLIIVSGNLDEAFGLSNHNAEVDIDADIFHAFSTKVTIMDIKTALSRKFRPEQVARFGNIHLIYPSLSKKNFYKLIDKEVTRIISDIKKKTGIDVYVDDNIINLIYRNGVFPTQGVRPLFSSIADILEVNICKYLFEVIENKAKNLSLTYVEDKKIIVARFNDKVIETKFFGRIDLIKQNFSYDKIANVSVHEAGHAVAYMVLFNLVPLQLISKVASTYSLGFTFPHDIYHTHDSILKMIKVLLSGKVAEEIIFGESNISMGSTGDRIEATKLASDYIRKLGFGDFHASYAGDEKIYELSIKKTDKAIESFIGDLEKETKDLLNNNIDLLKSISQNLSIKGHLSPLQLAELAKEFDINVYIKEEGHLEIPNYHALLNKSADN